ncbi:MAG: molybdenum cofactor guanylyltransferase [Anaerolineales bacterium]|nr:molybdenum cofactor guanylyltransferase [Anaerolineales bacterium]
MNLTLVINAGGQSRRMGQPKALLQTPPDGAPLIAHITRRLAVLRPQRRVVVSNDSDLAAVARLPGDTYFVADAYPDTGTLGGIATGLLHTPAWAAVVACDLPLVSGKLFTALMAIAAEADGGMDRWDAVVPVVGGYEEPLHALYHWRCLPAIEERLAQGQRRVISFMPDVRTRYVDEGELRAVDSELRSFMNVNTPEEWSTALALLQMEGSE